MLRQGKGMLGGEAGCVSAGTPAMCGKLGFASTTSSPQGARALNPFLLFWVLTQVDA